MIMIIFHKVISLGIILICLGSVFGHKAMASTLDSIAMGWSSSSVNTAVFRASSVVSHGDVQFVSFYDPEGYVTLAKHRHGSKDWQVHHTQYKGNVADGHNVISMGVDGEGFLHVAFDHHGHPLRYARSVAPESLELGELESMTGIDEGNVTYPEFYNLPGGDLLFVYRSGASGRGNMAINRYITTEKRWKRVQDSLLDGQEVRSPYWQLYVDANGVIHVSWVWRETWLVETNHDLCYARSSDGGRTWQRSDGSEYQLPITAQNAEYALRIPQNSELINQTSMTADTLSHPYIATYWRSEDSEVPQYRIVWHDGEQWHTSQVANRTEPFSLSGGGTKMIPVSRPRIVVDGNRIALIVRDAERGSHPALYVSETGPEGEWKYLPLTSFSVDAWEASFDIPRWQRKGILSIFIQNTHQGDGERTIPSDPTPVYILETRI